MATTRMAEELGWFEALSAQTRSHVSLVAQAGITGFVSWIAHPEATPETAGEVFGAAPKSVTSEVSLQQVVDLVRLVVDLIEEQVPKLAADGDEAWLREAALIYAREIAFGAAQVYAAAAEQRGAWDARLEALVVDAVLNGDAQEDITARAAALGWNASHECWVLVGDAPEAPPEVVVERVTKTAKTLGLNALAGVHGRRLVTLLAAETASEHDREKWSAVLADSYAPGPVVRGPFAEDLTKASDSAAAAIAGLDAVAGWPRAPRPVHADDLLPERLVAGDPVARALLIGRVFRPLAASSTDLLGTAEALLEAGGSVEAAARTLYLHANTVRYRVRKICDLVGLDLLSPRDAVTVGMALRAGRLAPPL